MALPLIQIPSREQAIEVSWDTQSATSRGIYGFDSIDPRSRSFNLVRRQLLQMHREREWRLFGIVSATPNVGKSFISANIAAALSRDPQTSTCVVDLDLRRGSLSSVFGLDTEGGVLAFLSGTPGVQSPSTYTLEGERLLVMPTHSASIRSAELLASERAQSMLRSMRASGSEKLYLFDLPPAFANDDASTIMPHLDAYILVAEEGKTRQRELNDAVGLLGEDQLAGVILNKYRGGLLSEGYGVEEYYATGYDHGLEDR